MDRSPSVGTPVRRSRPPRCAKKSPAPCTSPGRGVRCIRSTRSTSTGCTRATRMPTGSNLKKRTETSVSDSPILRAPSQVWFLTGSQGLYGQETLDQVADQSRRVADLLAAGKPGAEIVWKPVLTSADAIRRIALDANSDDDCIGLIAWMHTFSPAKMWIAGMDALRKPLLHLHTQANEV